MDKIEGQPKEKDAIHANKLPREIVGRFLQNLSVGDRLKSERVSPLLKRALEKWGWTEQRKLNREIVFEGANDNENETDRFWKELDNESCHLTSLLQQCALWLHELDLSSFGGENIARYVPQVVETLQSLGILEKLDIGGLRLQDFVEHLPPTLRELKTSDQDRFSVETLQTLSNHCPNLREVPFDALVNKYDLKTEVVIKLVGKFPRQKNLDLFYFPLQLEKQGALVSIGHLNDLEKIHLWYCESLDGDSLEAIVEGCPHLRLLSLPTDKLTEDNLFKLVKLSNLTVLNVFDAASEAFSDAVLKAIAQRGQLKKLVVVGGKSKESSFTDNSILYLLDRCKLLVTLRLFQCTQITERSVEAIVAEVRRRHETTPETLPFGHLDPEIFYFEISDAGIKDKKAEKLISDNPWIKIGLDPREII